MINFVNVKSLKEDEVKNFVPEHKMIEWKRK